MRRLCLLAIVLALAPGLMSSAQAAKIYQWRDANGQMHFTDSLSKVPPEYRKHSGREVEAIKPVQGRGADGKASALDGRALYEEKCAGCHVLGFQDEGKREGLGWAIVDHRTKFPRSEDELVNKLRFVVDGGVDMPPVEIGDDELRAIARYMIKKMEPR